MKSWEWVTTRKLTTAHRAVPICYFSLLHRRHPMFRLRLSIYPSPQLLQTDGCLYHLTPLLPLDERNTHRSGPFPPGAFGCTPINRHHRQDAYTAVLRPTPPPGRLRRHFPLTVIGGASSAGFPRRAPRASPVDTSSFVPYRR
jgi:hypothetical protein